MNTRRELLAALSAAAVARMLRAMPLADIKLGITTDEIDDDVLVAAKILDEHGIKVSIEGTGFFKIPLPPDTAEGRQILDKQWALLAGAMERARAFGTDKIRTFTFMLGKGEEKNDKAYARIWELTREAA